MSVQSSSPLENKNLYIGNISPEKDENNMFIHLPSLRSCLGEQHGFLRTKICLNRSGVDAHAIAYYESIPFAISAMRNLQGKPFVGSTTGTFSISFATAPKPEPTTHLHRTVNAWAACTLTASSSSTMVGSYPLGFSTAPRPKVRGRLGDLNFDPPKDNHLRVHHSRGLSGSTFAPNPVSDRQSSDDEVELKFDLGRFCGNESVAQTYAGKVIDNDAQRARAIKEMRKMKQLESEMVALKLSREKEEAEERAKQTKVDNDIENSLAEFRKDHEEEDVSSMGGGWGMLSSGQDDVHREDLTHDGGQGDTFEGPSGNLADDWEKYF